ncbi:hypothetical protein J7E91_33590 [Streptomyces sp. ISL-99]|uniref:VOC family protein n=1 Tax=Streptomyces sp. ISL-99 TaxID=2819193 RepID=UPI001BEB9DD6|nr:VOC family protein [Streptomyces sp. ISL-99]MBT2530160.1 hypothetical protein [Streptomyces sp. ISL-99]
MPAQMKLTAVTLDCPDPLALAAFYQQATGLELHDESNGDFAGLTRGDGLCIGFQRVDDAHAWPQSEWEPAGLAVSPVWLYPRERSGDERNALGPQRDALREAIGAVSRPAGSRSAGASPLTGQVPHRGQARCGAGIGSARRRPPGVG